MCKIIAIANQKGGVGYEEAVKNFVSMGKNLF